MTSYALEVEGLRHRFRNHLAVAGVTFQVPAGAIHGFVGPNGAGKTTTLKIVGTLITPQAGRVRVFGKDIVQSVKDVRREIGYMPDHFSMYKQMTVYEYLDFFAAAYGQDLAQRGQTVTEVLELTDMQGRADSLIKGLSRGMQQRVSLARVLVHDPRLLLLDEPASGLDPRARIELMAILRELAKMGKTVFISSHILSELATLCDSVTIIDRGKIKYSGGMEELLTRSGDGDAEEFVVQTTTEVEGLPEFVGQVEGVRSVDTDAEDVRCLTVTFDAHRTSTKAILQAVLAHGADVESFQRNRRHLDEAFMDLTEPGVRS